MREHAAMVTRGRTLAQTLQLFAAFRLEQVDPDAFYGLMATDGVAHISRFLDLEGAKVVDVGGGAGYFAAALRAAGARCLMLEPSMSELSWRGGAAPGSLLADGYRMPFANGALDMAFSSNVLEHVARPEAFCEEMVRVTRPGGIVFACYTNWLSPLGGHETRPWHYLGGELAARHYERRHGTPPKNRYGESLFAIGVGRMLGWARSCRAVEVLDASPRYHPWWAAGIVRVPLARELLSLNLALTLRKR